MRGRLALQTDESGSRKRRHGCCQHGTKADAQACQSGIEGA